MNVSRELTSWKLMILSATSLTLLLNSTALHGEDPKVLAFDGFDKKLELPWEPLRADEANVSLTKNEGKLTIITQTGTLGGDQTKPGSSPSQNLYLIPTPESADGDFVVTTCIESFNPTMKWQQAGLLIYDDDDNYLKCDMEFSGTAIRFKFIRERAQFRWVDTDKVVPSPKRTWIRITKRGKVYERSYSTDGKQFISAGEKGWGDGDPRWVGIIAQNGPIRADNIDAAFDFFKVRELTDDEKSDARYAERKKLDGGWEVVSSEFNGDKLEHSPFSAFAFDGGSVTFADKDQTVEVEYTLDPKQNPKQIVMSGISREAKGPAYGVYSLNGDALVICLTLKPGAPAPTELKTADGDSRLLLKLKRSAKEQSTEEKPADEKPGK